MKVLRERVARAMEYVYDGKAADDVPEERVAPARLAAPMEEIADWGKRPFQF